MKINDLNYNNSTNTRFFPKNSNIVSKEDANSQTTFKTDSMEISDEGKRLSNYNISATSGKDKLGISKGKDENSFVVHFQDSAMVSRAVARGYITVNGKRIELLEEDKKSLIEEDKKAEAQRLYYFNMSSLEHNMKVAQQQSAAWEWHFKQEEKILKLQLKLAKGEKITPEEEKMLLEKDPQGYQIALMLRNMNRDKKKTNDYASAVQNKNEENYMKDLEKRSQGISIKDTEWKGADTTLNISFSGEKVTVGEISAREFFINKVD